MHRCIHACKISCKPWKVFHTLNFVRIKMASSFISKFITVTIKNTVLYLIYLPFINSLDAVNWSRAEVRSSAICEYSILIFLSHFNFLKNRRTYNFCALSKQNTYVKLNIYLPSDRIYSKLNIYNSVQSK